MCWFTLTPIKDKQAGPARSSSDSSCVEEIVRVHRSSSPRFSDVKVKIPGGVSLEVEDDYHHHHHHLPHMHSHMEPHLHPHLNHHHRHHLHPLHLHPLHGYHHHHDFPVVKLRGPGRKRCPPPSPPPPSRAPSRCRPHSRSRSCSPARPKEPIYRTQIVEPTQVRETTRAALRIVEPERPRGRLRRVAGYEVLGREVPWTWDCVSSTVGSSSAGGGKWTRKKKGPPYPPFGNMDRWL